MVMATGSLCQQYGTGDLPHEEAAAADMEGSALHERLVAYVHALAPPHEARSGVWVEHSYARARGAPHAAAAHVRVLLAPAPDPPDEPLVDVEREPEPPPEPPEPPLDPPSEPSDDDDAEDEWEPRVTALAPAAAHAVLASRALDALRRLRLARLAAPGRAARAAEPVRAAARRLRLALVLASAAPGAAAQRPGPWLHATLLAYMPRATRRLYEEVAAELRRAAPRLARRALGPPSGPPAPDPLAAVGPAAPPDGVWLVWLSGGAERQDRRWRRRLGALLHTRVLAVPAPAPGRPDAWCAALAAAMRQALSDTLAEAGTRPVILGGAGAGATLCLALAGAGPPAGPAPGGAAPSAVRGLLLLAPPLLTAEGARDSPDDPLGELRVPLLVVAGERAAASWRGAARHVCAPAARRLLEVRGADHALRAPARLRRARRLPQHALDAAIAEECARWALETAEGAGRASSPPRSPPRAVARRRTEPRAAPPPAPRPAPPPPQVEDDEEEEEYAHLPTAVRSEPAGGAGAGRVVSRGPGGTPLALLPPRRQAPGAVPPALAAADIMRLPIVFADDEAPDSPVTVTSGDGAAGAAPGYTRVIVASRGNTSAARPLLLRRAVRLLPRNKR